MDDRVIDAMWKGGTEPTSNPHRCPSRPDGMERKDCPAMSGRNPDINRACCGTMRGTVEFPPCNSNARRCRVCMENGLRGEKANAVTDVEEGTCDVHKGGKVTEQASRQVRPLAALPQKKVVVDKAIFVEPLVVDEALVETAADSVPGLNARQLNVLRHLADGLSNGQIVEKLPPLNYSKVASTVTTIYTALGVHRILNWEEKREMAARAYKRYIEKQAGAAGGNEPLESGSDPPGNVTLVYLKPEMLKLLHQGSHLENRHDKDEVFTDSNLKVVAERLRTCDERCIDVLRVCASGIVKNRKLELALDMRYSLLAQLLTAIYKAFGIAHLPKKEKRQAAVNIYLHLVEKKLIVPKPPVSDPEPEVHVEDDSADADPPDDPVLSEEDRILLESKLNHIIDVAEATLEMFGLKRRTKSENQ